MSLVKPRQNVNNHGSYESELTERERQTSYLVLALRLGPLTRLGMLPKIPYTKLFSLSSDPEPILDAETIAELNTGQKPRPKSRRHAQSKKPRTLDAGPSGSRRRRPALRGPPEFPPPVKLCDPDAVATKFEDTDDLVRRHGDVFLFLMGRGLGSLNGVWEKGLAASRQRPTPVRDPENLRLPVRAVTRALRAPRRTRRIDRPELDGMKLDRHYAALKMMISHSVRFTPIDIKTSLAQIQ